MQNYIERQVVLDTETTGIEICDNIDKTHRIIEIGAVEIIDRHLTENAFHTYLNPHRLIDKEAFKIHGISDSFLTNKPNFKIISREFINFIKNSELIIHNASFDIKFIEHEFKIAKINIQKVTEICTVIDTLDIARKKFPGKKNTLDVLCDRLQINKEERRVHSALLDAELLAKVYLRMTRKQKSLIFSKNSDFNIYNKINFHGTKKNLNNILLLANNEEISNHEKYLNLMEKKSKNCIWMK
ncbi:DNA polymerase III subunit epsilon [Buchnera aphidicola (Hormaphis cornu)]|nr:DNA polymerase III subunit epsilon [Buchnera aphidicola (Hormaphis cornu)]